MTFPRDWLSAADPGRVFLDSPLGTLTYGELAAVGDRLGPPSGQVVVTPGSRLEDIHQLLGVPGPGRQLVVIDPRLPASERRRRVEAAAAAATAAAATVVFTSGSTGPARAVRLTEANWGAAVEASAVHLEHRPDDVWLAVMPMHHVGGLAILYRSAYVGARVRWMPRAGTAEVVAGLRSGVTIASLVPTVLRRVLDGDTGPFPGLRAVLVGGGPIPPGLIEQAHARGIPALPTYGMTETCAQVATLRPGSPPRGAAHPLPGIEVRIADDGRIQVRGPQVSPGYAGEDDRAPREWFTTSDLGRLEPDGALRVLGRADDVILTGGENVTPGEVEAVLVQHPAVRAAAVIGLPDPEWGQRVVAAYEGDRVEPAELLEWLRPRLAPHQVPRRLLRLDAIPLSGGGKPDRERLRALLT